MEDPQAPEELARIHEQLWQTVLQFGNFSASQERNRIARDLHDSLGHALTALNIQLQTAVKLWQLDPVRAEQFLTEAQRLGSTAVKEVRQTVKALRTDAPEERSIETLLDSLVESFHGSTGITPGVSLNLWAPLPPEIVVPIYRIFQEGLNNICKYAQATEVQLQLITSATSLGLVIQDNGRGFDLHQTTRGFGLRGMQERVSMLQGHFQVDTQPGQGCRIRAVIPLHLSSSKPIDSAAPAISPPESPPLLLPLAPVNGPPPTSKHLSDLVEVNYAETVIETHRGARLSKPNQTEILNGNHGAQTVLQGIPARSAPIARSSVNDPIANPAITRTEAVNESINGAVNVTISLPGDRLPGDSFPREATENVNSATGAGSWELDATDCDRLTQILIDFIGPIAPTLVQTAMSQVQTPQALINQLLGYISPQQQPKFIQQTCFLLEAPTDCDQSPNPEKPSDSNQASSTNQSSTNQTSSANQIPKPSPVQPGAQTNSGIASASASASPIVGESRDLNPQPHHPNHHQTLDETAIAACEQELTTIVGPVAHFLIQQILAESPAIGLTELVERLVHQLPDDQKGNQFKQRILNGKSSAFCLLSSLPRTPSL